MAEADDPGPAHADADRRRVRSAQCIGQMLREDVYAERDNPPFDRVCMDGIAIDSVTFGRGVRRYAHRGDSQPAGAPRCTLVDPEHAIEVMTGAILPLGTDCVIPLEEYDLAEGVPSSLKAEAQRRALPQRAAARRGQPAGRADAARGPATRRAEIAVAASAGLASVQRRAASRALHGHLHRRRTHRAGAADCRAPGAPLQRLRGASHALRAHGFEQVAERSHRRRARRSLRAAPGAPPGPSTTC